MPSYAYMGKILWVDLSNRRLMVEKVDPALFRKLLSGMGLAAWYLYRRIPAETDPLGPDNILGFVSGLLTGTGSLFTGRWMVVAKSPLTGTWGDANCGGNFSPAIKQCGFDAIFFTGISSRPVYLYADGGKAELRDASHLWGKDTIETERWLIKNHKGHKRARVACIGPAGERLSLIAGIANDGGRMAARSGLGAVMGSKKLKAVVLAGSRRVKAADPGLVKQLSCKCNQDTRWQPPFLSSDMMASLGSLMRVLPAQAMTDGLLYKILLRKWGTVSMNQASIEMGDAPVKNWDGCNLDFPAQLSEPIGADAITRPVRAKYFCYSCPLGCGGLMASLIDPKREIHRPEYETTMALGPLLMNNDAASIFYLNDLLNRAGMDTISAGGAVALAIECFQKGLLTKSEADGLELTWGNRQAIISLVEKMVRREGVGALFADGAAKAAARIGPGAQEYAICGGGQSLGMHDSRFDPGFAIHYVLEPSPGKHTVGSQLYYEMFGLWHALDNLPEPGLIYLKGSKYKANKTKAVMAAACSCYMNVLNGAGACLFGAFLGIERLPVFEWLNAAAGWQLSNQEYMEIGKRVQTLRQLFNIGQGIDPARIEISKRALGQPPQKRGANKGRKVALRALRRLYWKEMGWDPDTGIPGDRTCKRLGLDS